MFQNQVAREAKLKTKKTDTRPNNKKKKAFSLLIVVLNPKYPHSPIIIIPRGKPNNKTKLASNNDNKNTAKPAKQQ